MFLLDKLFPNTKEITETMAGYNAIATHLTDVYKFGDAEVQCLCVGDGHVPRTAAFIACMTKWNCFSIDPALRAYNYRYKRLTLLSKPMQECESLLSNITGKPVILLLVHAHVTLDDCLKVVKPHRPKVISIVAMPCCVPQTLGVPPNLEYSDNECLSHCNTIKVWKNVLS